MYKVGVRQVVIGFRKSQMKSAAAAAGQGPAQASRPAASPPLVRAARCPQQPRAFSAGAQGGALLQQPRRRKRANASARATSSALSAAE
eukprot:CAMPEP_0119183280 /NCGR_PEP_ID=MMETSP1315-20130426/63832_1 /TAXON_ID=676789 /ORGANISM="Prasinoderma singularis, Strain RCC927" /LENGTH=88 /DNA_ID=CAMNT_0007177653 /DNA_START=39 /DNA_END=306 /DNA_ORIENTATION=-